MNRFRYLILLATLSVPVACSVQEGELVDMSGGAQAVGGSTSVGGTSAIAGGAQAVGGTTSVGGTAAKAGGSSNGGTQALGGATNAGGISASGGTITFGGATANTGGGNPVGGASATGGKSGIAGTPASGGMTATGGTLANLGGVSSTGGSKSGGGAAATGGTISTGGTLASGGATSAGGNTASGGMVNLGGTAASSPCVLDFVLDVSGSMNDVAQNTANGQSKWVITRSALQSAIGQLPQATLVGLLMFPNMYTIPNNNTIPIDVSNCVNVSAMISVQPISSSSAAISSALQTALIAGGTPTDDAYTYAFNNGMLPALQTHTGDRPFMVLITDGQPTISLGCEGTGAEVNPVSFQPMIDAITAAYAGPNYVKTFVIGLPGSDEVSSSGVDGRENLSDAAAAGQTGPTGCSSTGVPEYCHFDLSHVQDFAIGLQQALQSIVGTCT